jgi:serine/threonine protein kinase
LHLTVDVTFEDIRNEIRAVKKLCTSGSTKYIVEVINDGILPDSCYFLDMELCDLNLENYINCEWPQIMKNRVPYLATEWSIMGDVLRGLAFIHSKQEIHRDLKPRNSSPHHFINLLTY